MRANITYKETKTTVKGEEVIEEMLKNRNMLIPVALDPHGCMDLLMKIFLLRTSPKSEQFFKDDRPNAGETNHRLLSVPYPSSMLKMAVIN